MLNPKNRLATDLDHILKHTEEMWEELRGKRLFITGGTGFFGTWLLESFAWANTKLNLNASALVLTRSHAAFKKKAPHLALNPSIQFHVGDVRNFDFPKGKFSHVIHAAATSAVATFNKEDPLTKFDTVVSGTRHTLDFSVACKAKKFLLTSSGAVYGKQPAHITHIPEDYSGAPDVCDVNATWGESKRVAELFSVAYAKKYGIEAKIARCFTFLGPYLPLDIHYAIGNFIGDVLSGRSIMVRGDGTPYRSYLYAVDLVIWLWTILFQGRSCRAYNVGSDASITIAELADMVAKSLPKPAKIKIAKKPICKHEIEHYVPDVSRALTELNLKQTVDLKEAICRTLLWYNLS